MVLLWWQTASNIVKIVGPGTYLPSTPVFVVDVELHELGASEFRDGVFRIRLRPDVAALASGGNGRARFTAAYELAHVTIHHRELQAENGRAFRDPVCTPSARLQAGVRIFESPDWQANAWAGAFLIAKQGVVRYLKELDDSTDFEIQAFATHFQVSVEAARIRIDKLLKHLLKRETGSGH